ncbi:hypothetical protein Btru_031468 [Bulinus truncatus]|nr:hypothetical protein Btru_031468 [Bulinus truncatus]
MTYLSSGYWNWLGGGRSEEGVAGKDSLLHQTDVDAMFRGTKCPLSLWNENRRLYMDNLRLWDCLTLIRSDPSITCQSAINLVFGLRDSEYLISFPDTHQLMLLRYPTGFVSHTNIDDAKLENIRLKDENSRLHAAIWVLRDNPSLQADSTVAAIFRLDEPQFQSKFHADPDISGGGLFKFTDKQTYLNNNKVYMASLDIGTEPNMAIQLTNKPIRVGMTSSRRCRSASSRRPHSSGYPCLAQSAVTRKRSGSSIHHRNSSPNWRTERMFFIPEEDTHAGLYTKRSPRLYSQNDGSVCLHQRWPANDEQGEFTLDIRSDRNNSQFSGVTSRDELHSLNTGRRGPNSNEWSHGESRAAQFRRSQHKSQGRLSCEGAPPPHKVNSPRARKKTHKTRHCLPPAVPRRKSVRSPKPYADTKQEMPRSDCCSEGNSCAYERSREGSDYLDNEGRYSAGTGEVSVIACSSQTNIELARRNRNENKKDELPVLSAPGNREPSKIHLKDTQAYTTSRAAMAGACSYTRRTGRPLSAKRRDFKRLRRDNLLSVAKWSAREEAEGSAKKRAEDNVNESRTPRSKPGVSSNNSTVSRSKSVKYDDTASVVYDRSTTRALPSSTNYPLEKPKYSLLESGVSETGRKPTLANKNVSSDIPDIWLSDLPSGFRPPFWQPYSFTGFTSVKHFLDRQKWLMDGEMMMKSDKTFFTRAILPSMFALGEEDYLTSKRNTQIATFSPLLPSDYLQIKRRGSRSWPPRKVTTYPHVERPRAKDSAYGMDDSAEAGQLKGCANQQRCKNKSQSLKLLYGMGTWKYTKPLATMIKRSHCMGVSSPSTTPTTSKHSTK